MIRFDPCGLIWLLSDGALLWVCQSALNKSVEMQQSNFQATRIRGGKMNVGSNVC